MGQKILDAISAPIQAGWTLEVFITVFVTLVLGWVAGSTVRRAQNRLTAEHTVWNRAVIESLGRPLQALIWTVGLTLALELAASGADEAFLEVVEATRDLGIVAAIAWFLIRLIERSKQGLMEESRAQGKSVDYTTVDAIAKLLRLTVIITAILAGMQILGFSIAGVLTFGGVGGIAVGFAARDLLANFFGGLMIYMDRPFSVGDWIRSPDRSIEGTVEDIGWRITRIRTFDSRPLYVPNSAFTTIALENPSRMQNRRIYETIGIRYDDAAEMREVVTEVEAMLRSREDIDQQRTLIVNFDAFAASSLDFFIYCFTKTVAWAEYHQVKQDVLLNVLDIIHRHGAECAYPTSTVHLLRTVEDDNP